MPDTRTRECLNCGMLHYVHIIPDERPVEQHCSKCDAPLFAQTDGSTFTADIAHQHETISEALRKFELTLAQGWQGYARQVRLIVGGGAIREAVLAELYFQKSKDRIIDYIEEGGNRGAVLIRIR